MADIRISNLADILVNYSVEVEPGHLVGIDCVPFNPSALPYLQEVTRAVLKAGGHPLLDLEPEFFSKVLLDEGDDAQDAELKLQVMLTKGESVKGKAKEGMMGNYFERLVRLKVLEEK